MSCYMIRRFFFFKQKTAYEMRISDWSSDVCSSDLATAGRTAAGRQAPPYPLGRAAAPRAAARRLRETGASYRPAAVDIVDLAGRIGRPREIDDEIGDLLRRADPPDRLARDEPRTRRLVIALSRQPLVERGRRSEEHTSELQAL